MIGETIPETISANDLNAHLAVINELAVGYVLNGEQWMSPELAQVVPDTMAKVQAKSAHGSTLAKIQYERGKAMGYKLRAYLVAQGYSITALHWVAKKGTIVQWVPEAPIDHPADWLLRLESKHPAKWLGVSCKARSDSRVVGAGVYNPGLEDISTIIGIDLRQWVTDQIDEAVVEWSLPSTQQARKQYIRADLGVQARTQARGDAILEQIRDMIRWSFPQGAIETFVKRYLRLDILPRYIHVIGTGDLRGCSADIVEPSQTFTGPYRLEPRGSHSLVVHANGAQVCIWRLKWTTEKLCGSIKISVEQH
jgi:hypothetical protein